MGRRTDVPMTGPSNFNELVPPFLHYKNVSKIFYELLRPIPTHAERPQDFKKNVIALLSTYVKITYVALSSKISLFCI